MSALDYSAGFGPETEFNVVLLHPLGRAVLERWGAVPTSEEERYALATCPLALAIRTAPALENNNVSQEALLAELMRMDPSDPSDLRRPHAVTAIEQLASRGDVEVDWSRSVSRYGRFELCASGLEVRDAYAAVEFTAIIQGPSRVSRVLGFFDGEGVHRLRFMPSEIGEHRFVTESNAVDLDDLRGTFSVGAAVTGRHGPVRAEGFHFRYDDGVMYRPIGTTAYAWLHQTKRRRQRTLAALADSGFTKVRMCLHPKWFAFNEKEPIWAAFERSPDGNYDFTRPDVSFWREVDEIVQQLGDLGIEADVILFHPYDRWGFEDMGPENDDRYVRYAAARLSAYANVWWSLANEHDVMVMKTTEDWERMATVLVASDPTGHLRSIHHCLEFYDHGRPWISHASIQHAEVQHVVSWRERWGKPVVLDECGYEGDLGYAWGDLTPQEMTHRHWSAAVQGGYAGHGETYAHPDDEIWWATGGELRGESPTRIDFLRSVMGDGPAQGWEPQVGSWLYPTAGIADTYYLAYLGRDQPAKHLFVLDPSCRYAVDVIDTWEMTITRVAEGVSGRVWVPLPARPYIAVRFTAKNDEY